MWSSLIRNAASGLYGLHGLHQPFVEGGIFAVSFGFCLHFFHICEDAGGEGEGTLRVAILIVVQRAKVLHVDVEPFASHAILHSDGWLADRRPGVVLLEGE